MQYSIIALSALATVASAAVNGTASAVWVTDIVTDFTTFCPASTTFSAYGQTYTVTEATTIVLPCPCTSSYTVIPTSAVAVPTTHAVVVATTPAVVVPASSAVVVPVYSNATSVAPVTSAPAVTAPVTAVPVGTAAPTTVAPASSTFTGAANAMAAPVGALAGVLGVVAYFL